MASICNECDTIFVAGELAKYPSVFPKDYQSKLSFYDHLKDATSAAIQMAKEGTILFSPSAASFDAFENYMDRVEHLMTMLANLYKRITVDWPLIIPMAMLLIFGIHYGIFNNII